MSIRQDKERSTLRRYLLGELPETERSELADRYFLDEEFFDELLDVENELLDQYVRGQLSPEEAKSFADYLRILPSRETKLATAYALMEAADELRDAPVPLAESARLEFAEATHVSRSRWEILRQSFLGGRHLLRYATAAILIALVAGLAYLGVTERRLHREVERLRAERAQGEQEKAGLAREAQTAGQNQAAERDRIRQLEQELAQARQHQERQSETGSAVLASLVLTPPLRSGSTPDSLTLLPTTKTVSLIIPVANGEQIASYRAVLQTTGGQLVLTRARLRPPRSRRGRNISLRFSAARLTGDSFKLTLQGKAAEDIEIAQDYYFNVLRK